jgi:uncharacterized protein DUF4166
MTEPNTDSCASLVDRDSQPHPRPDRPFQFVLGDAIHTLAPKVKEHVLQPPGTVVTYRGRMRVWRDGGWRGCLAGLLLRVGVLARTMFPETGDDVDFEMEHTVSSHPDDSLSMTWIRTFHFDGISRRFDALMRFGPAEQFVDWRGAFGCLQVELWPRAEDGAVVVGSGREWLRLGLCRIPIPAWLRGRPEVREWEEPDGTLRIRVEIRNAVLGQFFGYEGSYHRVSAIGLLGRGQCSHLAASENAKHPANQTAGSTDQ